MWEFNWGIFWAVLAALAVRRVGILIYDETLGKYAPSSNAELVSIREELVKVNSTLKEMKGK